MRVKYKPRRQRRGNKPTWGQQQRAAPKFNQQATCRPAHGPRAAARPAHSLAHVAHTPCTDASTDRTSALHLRTRTARTAKKNQGMGHVRAPPPKPNKKKAIAATAHNAASAPLTASQAVRRAMQLTQLLRPCPTDHAPGASRPPGRPPAAAAAAGPLGGRRPTRHKSANAWRQTAAAGLPPAAGAAAGQASAHQLPEGQPGRHRVRQQAALLAAAPTARG